MDWIPCRLTLVRLTEAMCCSDSLSGTSAVAFGCSDVQVIKLHCCSGPEKASLCERRMQESHRGRLLPDLLPTDSPVPGPPVWHLS